MFSLNNRLINPIEINTNNIPLFHQLPPILNLKKKKLIQS